jgi:hypothetical protein
MLVLGTITLRVGNGRKRKRTSKISETEAKWGDLYGRPKVRFARQN